jgi:hypothetical protein
MGLGYLGISAGQGMGAAFQGYQQGVEQKEARTDWQNQQDAFHAGNAGKAYLAQQFLGTDLGAANDHINGALAYNTPPPLAASAPVADPNAPASTGGTPGSTSAPAAGIAPVTVAQDRLATAANMGIAGAVAAAPAASAPTGLGTPAPAPSMAAPSTGLATGQTYGNPSGSTSTPQLTLAQANLQNYQKALQDAERAAPDKVKDPKGYNLYMAKVWDELGPQIQDSKTKVAQSFYQAAVLHNSNTFNHAVAMLNSGDSEQAYRFVLHQQMQNGDPQHAEEVANLFRGASVQGSDIHFANGGYMPIADFVSRLNPAAVDQDKLMEYGFKSSGLEGVVQGRRDTADTRAASQDLASQLRYLGVKDTNFSRQQVESMRNVTQRYIADERGNFYDRRTGAMVDIAKVKGEYGVAAATAAHPRPRPRGAAPAAPAAPVVVPPAPAPTGLALPRFNVDAEGNVSNIGVAPEADPAALRIPAPKK